MVRIPACFLGLLCTSVAILAEEKVLPVTAGVIKVPKTMMVIGTHQSLLHSIKVKRK